VNDENLNRDNSCFKLEEEIRSKVSRKSGDTTASESILYVYNICLRHIHAIYCYYGIVSIFVQS
jgi:hypothetical protein